MTVSSPVSRIVHLTHGAVSDYTFPFKVFKAGELAVDLVDASFRVIRLELGVDFTVAGLGLDQGGTITLTAAGIEKAGTGLALVMLRRMDFTQETDYRPHDVFPAETHERALDILTMICQELREMVGRAMIAPPNLDKPIQYSDLVDLMEGAEAARDAARTEADRAEAEAARSARAAARAKYGAAMARKWAANPEDLEVQAGLFSARHYAARAAQSVESLDLPDLNEASPGQVLTAVEWEGGGLGLEYQFPMMGKHLAEPFFHPDPDPPVGAIRARGETFHRGQYAALWAEVQRLHNKCVALGLPPLLVSDSDWQTEATTQGGYCAKYSTGDGSTTFRVPFYGRMFGAATTDAEIGRWVNDAIVNITGTFLGYDYENDSPASWSGAFTRNNAHKSAAAGNAQYGETPTYFDASRVVRTGPEVTPKAVYLPVYIHAFHAIQDSAVLQAQETLNALNAKLDAADYSGFPSDTYIDIPWGGSGMVYTAPADGWIFMDRTSSAAGQMVIMLVLTTGFFTSTYASGPGQRLGIFLPLSKGQTVEIHYNAPTPNYLAFIPARRAPGL